MKAVLLTIILFLVFLELPGQTNKTPSNDSPVLTFIKESKVRLDSIITIRESTGSKEKMHFLYNSEGYNTKCIHYFFTDSIKKWELSKIDSCTYDSAWNLTSVITDGQIKEEFTYDRNGKLLTRTYDSKDEYVYDKDPKKIFAVIFGGENCIFYFDSLGKIRNVRWAETDSLEFEYNINGNITSRSHFFHDPPLCPLVISEKDEYFYDGINKSIISKSSSSPFSGWCPDGTLNLTRESKYLYDKGFKMKDLILPYVFNFNPSSHYLGWSYIWNFLLDFKITERINYSGTGSLYNRIKYFYSDQTVTGAKELPEKVIRLYPNPASAHITIDFDGFQGPAILELFNGHGQSMMKKSVSNGNSLSVDHLPRGLYLYRLHLADTVQNGSVILF